jgi:hypothetical protein
MFLYLLVTTSGVPGKCTWFLVEGTKRHEHAESYSSTKVGCTNTAQHHKGSVAPNQSNDLVYDST